MEQGTTGVTGRKRRAGQQPRLFVEIGQRIGLGVVIETDARIQLAGSRTARAARLLCDCGNEYLAQICHLIGKQAGSSGAVKSCGCLARDRSVDRAGHRYGRLAVIKRAGRRERDRTALWLCRCDCGTEVIADARCLSYGETTSCGCARRKPRDLDAPQAAARNLVLRGYRRHARGRGLTWALSGEDFDRLTSQDCYYCGQPPSAVRRSGSYEGGEFTYNGIDRVDNDLGYTIENVVTCCKVCNNAKKDMPLDDFLAWIARLVDYHWFHPDLMPSRLLSAVV